MDIFLVIAVEKGLHRSTLLDLSLGTFARLFGQIMAIAMIRALSKVRNVNGDFSTKHFNTQMKFKLI